MAITMHLNIVSAEEEIFSGLAEMLIAPGTEGELGIMPQHTQLLSTLIPGELIITKQGGQRQSIFISGGLLEVQPHIVTVLSDTAIREKNLDQAKAEEAKLLAEQAIADGSEDIDLATAQAELLQAIKQLQMIEKIRKNKSH